MNGRRYHHLLNPTTGWPIENTFQSVSVVAERCVVSGSCASIAMLLGEEAGVNWLDELGLSHLRIDREGEVYSFSGA